MTVDTAPTDSDEAPGVQLDFISTGRSESMGTTEKLNMILDRVADGSIIVLEEGLNPDEQSKLIQFTMNRTDGETFTGIEIESLHDPASEPTGILDRLLNTDTNTSKITMIAPANAVETLNKGDNFLQTLVQGSF